MKMSCVAAVLSATLLSVGCGTSTEPAGGVAIVDLDRVAKELGRDTVMVQQLQQQQSGLQQQLAEVKTSFEQQLAESFEELPETPDEEQTKKLLTMKRNANIQLATYKQQASNALGQMKNTVISQFRTEVLPVARAVAMERKLSVVLTSNDSVVFTYDRAVDITDDVIARLHQSAAAPVIPATPAAGLKATPTGESTETTEPVTAGQPNETTSVE